LRNERVLGPNESCSHRPRGWRSPGHERRLFGARRWAISRFREAFVTVRPRGFLDYVRVRNRVLWSGTLDFFRLRPNRTDYVHRPASQRFRANLALDRYRWARVSYSRPVDAIRIGSNLLVDCLRIVERTGHSRVALGNFQDFRQRRGRRLQVRESSCGPQQRSCRDRQDPDYVGFLGDGL
jgi:hypothetical protein